MTPVNIQPGHSWRPINGGTNVDDQGRVVVLLPPSVAVHGELPPRDAGADVVAGG